MPTKEPVVAQPRAQSDSVVIPRRLWEIIQDWPALIQKTRMQATFLCPHRVYEAAQEAVPLWDAVFNQYPVEAHD